MVFQQWDIFNAFFVLVSSSVKPFPTPTPFQLKISWQYPCDIQSPLTLIQGRCFPVRPEELRLWWEYCVCWKVSKIKSKMRDGQAKDGKGSIKTQGMIMLQQMWIYYCLPSGKRENGSCLSSLIAWLTSGGKKKREREKSKLNVHRFIWKCSSLAPRYFPFWLSTRVVSAFLSRESQRRSNSPWESASGGICRERGARAQPCLLDMPQILNLPVTTITTQTTKCRFTDCFQQHPFKFTYIYTRKIRVSAIVTRDTDQDQ